MTERITVKLSDGREAELVTGYEYVITYRIGAQRYDREARMSFLGGKSDSLQFNARPSAGTQTFPARVLTSVTNVGLSLGREDSRRYVGRRARS
ncbi:MAG TPA: hypothetical protein VGR71_11745 [Nitrospira sp.]|nr:hypothetical protein [Nitrospira sp.]